METQLSKLRKLWCEGNFKACLGMAAGWPRLGDEKVAITRAWAALQNPAIYIEMGYDPARLVEEGYQALAKKYNLPL